MATIIDAYPRGPITDDLEAMVKDVVLSKRGAKAERVPERIMQEAAELVASGKMDHLFDEPPRRGQQEMSHFVTQHEVRRKPELARVA